MSESEVSFLGLAEWNSLTARLTGAVMVKKVTEEIEAAVNALTKVSAPIERALQAVQASSTLFSQQIATVLSNLDAAHENFRVVVERTAQLGAYGWTLPMAATIHDLLPIVNHSTDEVSADDAFVEFYRNADSAALRELNRGLLSQDALKAWRPLLEEAIFCLENGKYRSSVASLLPIIEGVLATNPGWQNKRDAFFAAKLAAVPSGSIEHSIWLSLQRFCNGLFASSDFSDPTNRPTRLNRHWILHGRDILSGELSDCLRLLQAIDTVSS